MKYTIGKAVSTRIKTLLFEKNMTIKELENEAQVFSISHIINDKINIKLGTAYKIANAFGMNLIEFLDCDYLKDKNIDLYK